MEASVLCTWCYVHRILDPKLLPYSRAQRRVSCRPLCTLTISYTGYLNTHEIYFSVLDTLPLFLAISIYVWFWPGKYLTEETRIIPAEAPAGEVEAPVEGSTVTMDALEK